MKMCCKEGGRSMIEMLGVLAIIGVLSVGGIAGYSKAMYRYRLNKTIEEITQIAGNVRAFFAPQKSYMGLGSCHDNNASCTLYRKAKLVPEEMWNAAGTGLQNPFDGNFLIIVTPKFYNNTCRADSFCNTQAFHIEMGSIPQEACIDLITQDWSDAGVDVIRVSNAENPTATLSDAYIVPPANIDHAVKICEMPASDTNEIDTFYLYFDVDVTHDFWVNYIANTRAKLDAM